jgi:hypothetical protein
MKLLRKLISKYKTPKVNIITSTSFRGMKCKPWNDDNDSCYAER